MSTKYFSFQGKAYIADRLPDGRAGPLRWLFNVPELSVALATETADKNESHSGQRLLEAQINRSVSAEVSMTLDGANRDNLALALFGSKVDVASGSVTGETFPSGLVADDIVRLDREAVSAVLLTDSATPTPANLVQGTHYEVADAFAGLVRILDPAAFVQPFVGAYSYAATESVVMFGEAAKERWIVFSGINTADNSPAKLDLYRAKLQPVQNLALINEEFGSFELTGQLLFDSAKAADPSLGGFGRWVTPAAT